MNFVHEHKFTEMVASASRTAGSTAVNGANIDKSDFEGVAVIVEFGPIAGTAVTSIKWQHSDTTAERTSMLIDLVRLADQYEGISESTVGPATTKHLDYHKERRTILNRMKSFRPVSAFA